MPEMELDLTLRVEYEIEEPEAPSHGCPGSAGGVRVRTVWWGETVIARDVLDPEAALNVACGFLNALEVDIGEQLAVHRPESKEDWR